MPDPTAPALHVTASVERHKTGSDLGLYSAGDVSRIRLTNVYPCCEDMREAWDKGAVQLGERDSYLNRDGNVNIAAVSVYPEGVFSTEFPINFCPFCAAPVVVTLTEAPDA